MEKLVKVSKFMEVLHKLPSFAEHKDKEFCDIICFAMTPKERLKSNDWAEMRVTVMYTDGTKILLRENDYDAAIRKLVNKRETFRCSNTVWDCGNTLSHIEIIHWC